MACTIFYVFSILIVLSSVMVVYTSNPVHSVLFLILTFVLSSVIFILLGAEFIAMLIVVVYVGAVAVLFLFIVMMIDVDYRRFTKGYLKYYFVALVFSVIFFANMMFIISKSHVKHTTAKTMVSRNVVAIGNLIYTKYMYIFHLSGVLLLIAIIGSLVLTLNHKSNVRRQNVSKQVNRSSRVRLINMKTREGVNGEFN